LIDEMKLRKRFMALAMAGVLLASGTALTRSALAEERITVILDGQFVSFTYVQPQIINDRTMVPVRELGEALDAEVHWDASTNSVLLTSGNRYATLRIDWDTMIYGTFTLEGGEMTATSAEQLQLQSPPVIVDERALFPLHAITYAFGINQPQWDAATRTVMISSAAQTPGFPGLTPPTTGTATDGGGTAAATPAPAAGNFIPNSDFYMEISGNTLQNMHTSRVKFAVVVFDGNNQAHRADVLRVIDAAATGEFRVHGFDVSNASGRFSSPDIATWIWELDDANRSDMPLVVFSFAGQQDYVVTNLSNQGELVDMFQNIALTSPRLPGATPTPSPSPSPGASPSPSPSPGASPSPSPSPLPGNVAADTFSWNRINLAQTQSWYSNHDSFAVFVYSTNDPNLTNVRSMVEEAARRENVPMFYASNVGDVNWIGRYAGHNQDLRTPAFFVVRGNRSDRSVSVSWRLNITTSSTDRSFIENELWSFRRHLN